jgi:hypothetical protein
LPGVALVLLLHLTLLWALLRTEFAAPLLPRERETIMVLPPIAKPPKPRPKIKPVRRTAAAPAQTPFYRYPALPLPQSPPDLKEFGRALFGCAPEQLSELSPEDRAHCTDNFDNRAFADLPPGAEMKERSAQAKRWAAAITARNAAVRIPCAYFTKTGGAGVTVPMADVTCILRNAIHRDEIGGVKLGLPSP